MRKNNARTKHRTQHDKRTQSRVRVPRDDRRRNLRQNSQQDRESQTLVPNHKQIPRPRDPMNQRQSKRYQIRHRKPNESIRLLQHRNAGRHNRGDGRQMMRDSVRGSALNDRSSMKQPARKNQNHHDKAKTTRNSEKHRNSGNATTQQTDGRNNQRTVHVRHRRRISNRKDIVSYPNNAER